MKRAEHGAKLKDGTQQPGSEAPPAPPPRGKASADARKDPSQLARNRSVLGVGDDHRTETMRKKRRGTYP